MNVVTEVGQAKSDVPRFILRREPRYRLRDRIGSVVLDEPKKGEKRSLSQNG